MEYDHPLETSASYRHCVAEALRLLDVDSLVISIQDPSLPSTPADDTGRGSPYSAAGDDLARFFRERGFTGMQTGPQGLTQEHSPSPYEGTLFSRDPLSISLEGLAAEGLIAGETLARAVRDRPPGSSGRVPYRYVFRCHWSALWKAFRAFRADREGGGPLAAFAEPLRRFAAKEEAWLAGDALFDLLRKKYGRSDWRQWRGPEAEVDRQLFAPGPGMEGRCRARREKLEGDEKTHLECYRFIQYLAHRQHLEFKKRVNRMGLKLYGDLQIGFSDGDVWACHSLFLPRYRLGAPPSRTNPEGQPWGYPVLNPALYGEAGRPGPAAALLARRMEKMFCAYDAVRIDHPHGLVCPWVYRGDVPDPRRAVRDGARLFSTPCSPDHPALAPFAIAAPRQLNPDPHAPRYGEDWVRDLDPGQVGRYAILFDVIVAAARNSGRTLSDLVPEVLSTLPFPLRRVLERYGLGRLRVTQKADLSRADDVYRSENASPEDWIMVGNHDTKPIWLVIEEWRSQGLLGERAAYLAARLEPPGAGRDALRRRLAGNSRLLAQAQFADLFASPARNVMIFFTDFFGMKETYNRPGFVSGDNWSLRLPPDFRRAYSAGLKENRVFNLPLALALALRSRGGEAAGAVGRKLLDFAPGL